jgi:hypothetical protein
MQSHDRDRPQRDNHATPEHVQKKYKHKKRQSSTEAEELVDEPFRKVAKKKAPFPPSPPVAPASLSSATRAPSNHKYRPQYQVEGASSDGSEGDDDDDDHFAAIRREYSSSSSLPKISQATRSKNQSGLMTRRGAPAENSPKSLLPLEILLPVC